MIRAGLLFIIFHLRAGLCPQTHHHHHEVFVFNRPSLLDYRRPRSPYTLSTPSPPKEIRRESHERPRTQWES